MLNRREFARILVSGGAALAASSSAWPAAIPQQAASNPADRYDFLIQGGTVVDPGQGLHAAMDVAVKNGKIAEVAREIPASRAVQVINAKGKIVTPGLIDMHAHCYDGVSTCVNADSFCLTKGVTTVVDAGSAGYPTVDNFRRYIINTSATRIKALVNISPLGAVGPGGTVDALQVVDADLTAKAVRDNRPATIGIKVRIGEEIQGANDVEYLRRGLRAAEAAGVPLMAHIDGPHSPLTTLLPMMRTGDIYSHFLHAHQNGTLDANGKVLPVALEAKQRGVLFDVAQGRSHLSFEVAEKCFAQGLFPDTLSTDLTRATAPGPVYDLPTIVSKFMALGIDIDKALAMATINPSRVFDYGAAIGTLKPGSEADVAVFELRQGNFEFEDSHGKKRGGRQLLVAAAVLHRDQLMAYPG